MNRIETLINLDRDLDSKHRKLNDLLDSQLPDKVIFCIHSDYSLQKDETRYVSIWKLGSPTCTAAKLVLTKDPYWDEQGEFSRQELDTIKGLVLS